jgi:hypothetical protein
VKNNSMNNYLNQSYKYNNNTNIKLVPKTKSLNNFNTNTLKILRHANQLNNSNSKPIKIKTNTQPIPKNKIIMNKPKTPNQDGYFNSMVQEYNYMKYLYKIPDNNNLEKKRYKYKLNVKRPSTAPQKNNNKKVGINKLNKSLNNSNYNNSANNENKPLYNYYSNNSVKLKNHIIKRTKNNFANPNMYNKIFRFPRYRPPSPMIEPGIGLIN